VIRWFAISFLLKFLPIISPYVLKNVKMYLVFAFWTSQYIVGCTVMYEKSSKENVMLFPEARESHVH